MYRGSPGQQFCLLQFFCACSLCLGFPFAKWGGVPGPRHRVREKLDYFTTLHGISRLGVEVELEPHSHKRAPQTLQIQPCSNLGVERRWVSACRDCGSLDTGTSHTSVPVLLALDVGGLACLILRSDVSSCWEPAQRALVSMSEVPTLSPTQVHLLGVAPYTTGSFPVFSWCWNLELGSPRLPRHTPALISSWQLPLYTSEQKFLLRTLWNAGKELKTPPFAMGALNETASGSSQTGPVTPHTTVFRSVCSREQGTQLIPCGTLVIHGDPCVFLG